MKIKMLSCLAGIVFGLACIPVQVFSSQCAIPREGMVSWWKGEGDATDLLGKNSGFQHGGISYSNALVGQGFSVVGGSHYIEIQNSPTLNPKGSFSIEAWVLPSLDGKGTIFSKWGGVADYENGRSYYFGMIPERGLVFGISDTAHQWDGAYHLFTVTQVLSLNAWNHVAAVYDQNTGTRRIFVNGVSVAERTDPPIIVSETITKVGIGVNFLGSAVPEAFFEGLIDEVSFYSTALSASDVLKIFQAGAAGKCPVSQEVCAPPPSGLVGWWRAEGSPSDATAKNPGVAYNGATFGPGIAGQAFEFDGANDHIRVADHPSLRVTNALTIEAWVYPNIIDATRSIVVKWDGNSSGMGAYSFTTISDGRFYLHVSPDGSGNGAAAAFSSNSLPANTWTHVAGTYDGADLRVYINGVLDGQTPYTNGIFPSMADIGIGGLVGGLGAGSVDAPFAGRIDEPTIYNRALSMAELRAIYNAGSAGKCPLNNVPPVITTQPSSTTVRAGETASFSVSAAGTAPLSYQWRFNGQNLAGRTDSTFVLANVQTAQAGNYSVVVSNVAGFVESSNALLTVTQPMPVVRLGGGFAGSQFSLPLELVSSGGVNALSFSLAFNRDRLTYRGVEFISGSGFENTNSLSIGRAGIAISLPAGASFPAGTQTVARVLFAATSVPSSTTTTISFTDSPIPRQVVNPVAEVLQAQFLDRLLTIPGSGYEGDVAPRPAGNGFLSVSDWVLVGRFAARLDTPEPGVEFQRADCAPRSTKGDGFVTISDWVQAGRYAAGLDPLTSSGGPSAPLAAAATKTAQKLDASGARSLSISGVSLKRGETGSVSVSLAAAGDENALGFSVSFDPAAVSFVNAELAGGLNGATLYQNVNEAESGKVGLALALSPGNSLPPGTREIVKLELKATETAAGSTSIAFADAPILSELADSTGSVLPMSMVPGTIHVEPLPELSIATTAEGIVVTWPAWASDFELQAAPDLSPSAAWETVKSPVTSTGSESSVTLPIGESSRYYRLQKP